LEELRELEEIYKIEYLHKKRVYEKKLEDWQTKHEICETLRNQRKKEYEEKMMAPRLGFNEQEMRFRMDPIHEGEEAVVEKPDEKLNRVMDWIDDVFEEPMPLAPQEKEFKEEIIKKNIAEVSFKNIDCSES
jgi:hypothetical protein